MMDTEKQSTGKPAGHTTDVTKGLKNNHVDSGSGNYDNDIPIDENVVNYHTNKTAAEERKTVALKDNRDRQERNI